MKMLVYSILLTSVAVMAAEEVVEQSMTIAVDGEVHVRNVNGSLTVKGWDKNEVSFKAVKKAKSESALKDWDIEVEASDSRIDIRARKVGKSKSWGWGKGGGVSIHMEVWVPREVAVHLKTTNGDIDAADLHGVVEAASTNGSVELEDLRGSVDARTTNGNVRATLAEHDGGDLSLRSTNGSIKLKAPGSMGAQIWAKTTNGSINSEIPMEFTTKSRKRLEGSINGGGASVHLKTTNGSISILEN